MRSSSCIRRSPTIRSSASSWHIPHLAVDSTSPLAIKQIVKLVETGQPVVIFPEGRITKTGVMMKVYDGAAFVAAKAEATVVPVRIDGAARSYFGRLAGVYPRKLFPKVTIAIQPRRAVPMPDLPSADCAGVVPGWTIAQHPARHAEQLRAQQTLFEAFLDGKKALAPTTNWSTALVEGIVWFAAQNGAWPDAPDEPQGAAR